MLKRNFKWAKIEQYAFDKIKRIVARDTLLIDLDFNESFKIRTNAINFQLEYFIRQKGKPIYLYSRNITEYQRRYTVIETELISIVETLK